MMNLARIAPIALSALAVTAFSIGCAVDDAPHAASLSSPLEVDAVADEEVVQEDATLELAGDCLSVSVEIEDSSGDVAAADERATLFGTSSSGSSGKSSTSSSGSSGKSSTSSSSSGSTSGGSSGKPKCPPKKADECSWSGVKGTADCHVTRDYGKDGQPQICTGEVRFERCEDATTPSGQKYKKKTYVGKTLNCGAPPSCQGDTTTLPK